jgi:hypothetical protein
VQSIAPEPRLTDKRVVYRPYQDAAADFPAIRREAFERAIWLIEPDGRVRCRRGRPRDRGTPQAHQARGMRIHRALAARSCDLAVLLDRPKIIAGSFSAPTNRRSRARESDQTTSRLSLLPWTPAVQEPATFFTYGA